MNRQRIRNWATTSGACPARSSWATHAGQVAGQLPRDAGGAAAGVQLAGLLPHLAQQGAGALVGQRRQRQAEAGLVGEGHEGVADAGEVRVHVDAVAHVHHQHKQGPGLVGRQGAHVAQGLLAGGLHHLLPLHGAAQGVALAALFGGQAQLGAVGLLGLLLSVGRVGALLGFQHEAAALVEVDAAGALLGPVVEGDGALQHVLVLGGVVGGRVGPGHAQQVAEVLQEQAVVGALGAAGVLPAGREVGVSQDRNSLWGRKPEDSGIRG